MAVQDFVIYEPFKNGDLDIDVSDYQNVQAIILAQPGQFYEFPTLGVGIQEQLNAPEDISFLRSTIINELLKDTYELTRFDTVFRNSRLEIFLDALKFN